MGRRWPAAIALLTSMALGLRTHAASGPPSGHDANDDVTVSGVFLDAAAQKLAVGSDFSNTYTVIDVTVTPRAGTTLALQPDDFLLRVGSNADRSGPLSAVEILGSGGLVAKKEEQRAIGATLTNRGYAGLTSASGGNTGASAAEIAALKAKMLPAANVTAATRGLLFFPIAKKKPKDLDLVYSAPPGSKGPGKLHIFFR